jgi:hypothetical protein
MSTPARAINPADYPELEQVQEMIPANAPPLLRRAYDLGMDKKLKRYMDCGQFSRYHACENGHLHCERSSRCELRCLCKDCAVMLAMGQLQKYEPLGQFMPYRFVYLEICPRVAATHDSICLVENTALRVLRNIPTKTFLKMSVSKNHTPEVRILYGHPLATADQLITIFRDAFPDADITASVHLKDSFYLFLKRLTADAPFAHDDPYRADLEFMFNRVRQLHVSGFDRVELSVCTSKDNHTDNSTETVQETLENCPTPCTECGETHKMTVRTCKICNLPMNHTSQWFLTFQFPHGRSVKEVKWKDGWQPTVN